MGTAEARGCWFALPGHHSLHPEYQRHAGPRRSSSATAYGALIIENDNWRDGPQLEIEETTLASTGDLESAVVTTRQVYTAVIHERNGQSGVGLFEVYNLQTP